MTAFLLQACGGGGSGGDGAGTAGPATLNPACTRDSTLNTDGTLQARTTAYLCATYGVANTRTGADGAPITMDYFVSSPASGRPAKAIVVLIAGSGFDTRITGNADAGPATGASGNFLVRSAQILANGDYLVVTLDRPADAAAGPFDELSNVDRYRTSARHAIDILTIANRVNASNLDLYIVGTSRGSMSVVANNLIATGIALSSPVTRGRADIPERFYLGDPRVPRLQASSMRRPSLVLRNDLDECDITPPAGAVAFYDELRAAGVDASSESATGGFKVTAGASAADLAPCESLGYHSFMGIENLAVGRFVRWLDGRIAPSGANRPPRASFALLPRGPGLQRQVDLATLTSDPDGDAVSFALPYAETSLGGSVALSGSTVTYSPPEGVTRRTDHFVYVATDGRGGVGAAVISVEIGN